MTEGDEPQWNLLPDHPAEFFSLSGEYDVRDLKRSYNALIKRFKPERFPAEFQRIRAAYEGLNDALRYGENERTTALPPHLQFDWDALTPPDEAVHRSPDEQEASAGSPIDSSQTAKPEPSELLDFVPLHERAAQEPLPDLYTELQQIPHKTPYDYYALAVISDVLQEKISFPQWLLKGLQAHPEEPALFQLLHQYFSSQSASQDLGKLLVQTSQVVRSDRFYYLTENAWDRLLSTIPFKTFRQVLESCEMNLLDHQVDHMLVFYVHLLKAAIWKADQNWLNDLFGQLEENQDRMPFWLEQEFEFLYLLRSYQEHRDEFLAGGSVRKLIDQCLIDYCTENEQTADRRFLECQHALVSQRDELIREFEFYSPGDELFIYLWETISADVLSRMETGFLSSDPQKLPQHTRHLAQQLFEEGNGAEYKKAVQIPWLTFALIFLISTIISMLCLIFPFERISVSLLIIGCLLFFNGISFFICMRVADVVKLEFYESWWRRQLMSFYQTNWHPIPHLAAELRRLSMSREENRKFRVLNEVAKMVHLDTGLWLYATAQRLLTACQ